LIKILNQNGINEKFVVNYTKKFFHYDEYLNYGMINDPYLINIMAQINIEEPLNVFSHEILQIWITKYIINYYEIGATGIRTIYQNSIDSFVNVKLTQIGPDIKNFLNTTGLDKALIIFGMRKIISGKYRITVTKENVDELEKHFNKPNYINKFFIDLNNQSAEHEKNVENVDQDYSNESVHQPHQVYYQNEGFNQYQPPPFVDTYQPHNAGPHQHTPIVQQFDLNLPADHPYNNNFQSKGNYSGHHDG
jgi:hypothetical protein